MVRAFLATSLFNPLPDCGKSEYFTKANFNSIRIVATYYDCHTPNIPGDHALCCFQDCYSMKVTFCDKKITGTPALL